ncbi:putative portal protein [Pseudoalteromonas virus vB_PspP-H6/1]|nr:putative portal protein [Pseudoalteromonas virus vB_PspP-H6/1]
MEFKDIKTDLKKAQDADEDQREYSREASHFVNKRDGQWEPEIISRMKGRPRYTDDRVNPIVDQICGEINNRDFALVAKPAGGDASKDVASTMDGMLRNIRNISRFNSSLKGIGRSIVEGGIGAFEIVTDYADGDAFDQDIFWKPIHDAVDRVWIDPVSYERDHSDAEWGVVFEYVSNEEYNRIRDNGENKNPVSLDSNRVDSAYIQKPDFVTVGRCYYRKSKDIEIVKMNNGKVYEVNDDFEMIVDELLLEGIQEVDRRVRKSSRFYMRYFDNDGYITEPEETVFDFLPICVGYGNYHVSEGKRIWRGVVEKLMDIQRVHNYAFSQQVIETALAPRPKYWMTRDQAKGNEQQLQSMNTSLDPVQFYNFVPNQAPPIYQGGAVLNPQLQTLIEQTNGGINQAAGLFAASLGNNANLQSGVAIERQVDQSTNGIDKWFEAIEAMLIYAGRVTVNAIPRVYDSTRQIRILGEDGSSKMVDINRQIIDQQTGKLVTINDLSAGDYDVVCEIGANYRSKREQAAEEFARIAAIDPTVMELGRDTWFRNIDAPGFDDLADRARQQMLSAGLIPQDQMSEEELAAAQAAAQQQQQQPDPNMVLAQAEMLKAQADMQAQQNKQAELQLRAADIQEKYTAQQQKLQSETALNFAKVEQGQQKLNQDAESAQAKQQMELMRMMLEQQKAQADEVAKLASALKSIKDAMGADVVVSENAAKAYDETAQDITGAS